jgi:hypothetical protein
MDRLNPYKTRIVQHNWAISQNCKIRLLHSVYQTANIVIIQEPFVMPSATDDSWIFIHILHLIALYRTAHHEYLPLQ